MTDFSRAWRSWVKCMTVVLAINCQFPSTSALRKAWSGCRACVRRAQVSRQNVEAGGPRLSQIESGKSFWALRLLATRKSANTKFYRTCRRERIGFLIPSNWKPTCASYTAPNSLRASRLRSAKPTRRLCTNQDQRAFARHRCHFSWQ